jgi:hypothetical protein
MNINLKTSTWGLVSSAVFNFILQCSSEYLWSDCLQLVAFSLQPGWFLEGSIYNCCLVGFSQCIDSDLCRRIVLYAFINDDKCFWFLTQKKNHPRYLKVIEVFASSVFWRIGSEVGDANASGIQCWIHRE